MPTYKYRCGNCGDEFSQFQKSIAVSIPSHSCCADQKIKKLIVGTNFALKGKGWYQDNYDKTNDKATDKTTDN
jgi:putative FmdB family regulatory protein